MAQTILSTASNQSEEWKPTWTVITSPPNFAERWAIRSASGFGQAGMAVPILWFVYAMLDGMTMWRTGNYEEGILLTLLGVISAIVAWDRYAFGQLIARYEAELRDIQTRRPTA